MENKHVSVIYLLIVLLVITLIFNTRSINNLQDQIDEMNQAILFSGQIVPDNANIVGRNIAIRAANVGLVSVDSFIVKYVLISNKIDDGTIVDTESTIRWGIASYNRTIAIPPQQGVLMGFAMDEVILNIPDHKHLLVSIESPSGVINKQIYNYTDGLLYIQDANHYELKDVFAYEFGMMDNYVVKDYQGGE